MILIFFSALELTDLFLEPRMPIRQKSVEPSEVELEFQKSAYEWVVDRFIFLTLSE